jgi:hypothetical protein
VERYSKSRDEAAAALKRWLTGCKFGYGINSYKVMAICNTILGLLVAK